jgi:hypothetical protein
MKYCLTIAAMKLQDLYEARQANLPKEERKALPKRPEPLTGGGGAGNAASGGHSNGAGAHSSGGKHSCVTASSLCSYVHGDACI